MSVGVITWVWLGLSWVASLGLGIPYVMGRFKSTRLGVGDRLIMVAFWVAANVYWTALLLSLGG